MTSQTLFTLKGKELSAIAHASPTAEITMTALALRQRTRHFSDLNRTKNALMNHGEKIVESDYLQLFGDLEKAGVGVIIRGRNGKPDRFEWYYSLKSIAKSALTQTDEQVKAIVSLNLAQEKPVKRKPRTANVVSETIDTKEVQKTHVVICIRNNFKVEFDVPSDIKSDELRTITETLNHIR